jgi:transcriptional regulator with XRE-family HTH domain
VTPAERIRHYRLRAGMSLRRLAAELSVSASAVSFWERGKERVPPRRVRALARALGVTPRDLMPRCPCCGQEMP